MKKYKTDVLAVFETHAGEESAARICRGLGFDNTFRVDAVGHSGGLWLLWKADVGSVDIVEASDQFIHARIVKDSDILNLIVVYAAPTTSRRSGLWPRLRDIIRCTSEPVIVGGDFNTIVRLDERSGGNGRLPVDSLAFGDWINELALIDMGFRGNQFTWKRGREESYFVAKRLDKI